MWKIGRESEREWLVRRARVTQSNVFAIENWNFDGEQIWKFRSFRVRFGRLNRDRIVETMDRKLTKMSRWCVSWAIELHVVCVCVCVGGCGCVWMWKWRILIEAKGEKVDHKKQTEREKTFDDWLCSLSFLFRLGHYAKRRLRQRFKLIVRPETDVRPSRTNKPNWMCSLQKSIKRPNENDFCI